MQCYIYKSLKKVDLYLYVTQPDDFSAVPEALLQGLGGLTFVMELALTPERKLARENAEKVINALNDKGFFVQMPVAELSLLPRQPGGHERLH
jgi:uncharacterized protein YcgL (UPF0745 family)